MWYCSDWCSFSCSFLTNCLLIVFSRNVSCKWVSLHFYLTDRTSDYFSFSLFNLFFICFSVLFVFLSNLIFVTLSIGLVYLRNHVLIGMFVRLALGINAFLVQAFPFFIVCQSALLSFCFQIRDAFHSVSNVVFNTLLVDTILLL